MPPISCAICHTARAIIKRPKNSQPLCRECFLAIFETEVHNTITENGGIFKRGEKIAIGASGGKDSTVLAYVMNLLNKRYDYGLDLYLLSIDEGITGYRDASLETVEENRRDYGLPLKILGYDETFGWTMDKIVAQVGKKNNCTFCGVFRRQALDRGALGLGINHIMTGHNADDIAETVLMNIMRGDIARLGRCTALVTQSDETTCKRSKPLRYCIQKEVVLYAYHRRLVYHSTECIYSPDAYRGNARSFLKDMERIRPSSILDIIYSGERFVVEQTVVDGMKKMQSCARCGYRPASNNICKACSLIQGLESGLNHSALKQRQDGPTAAPDGQRLIPQYEQHANGEEGIDEKAPVEGIERAMKAIAI